MADFDDITGWRDELETFEKTEEGRAFFAGNKRYRGRKMPYENVVQMIDLIFADEELHEALRKKSGFVTTRKNTTWNPTRMNSGSKIRSRHTTHLLRLSAGI